MINAPATMRVMSTDEATQGSFVVINAADFDPAIHTPFDGHPAEAPADAGGPAEPRRRGRPRKQTQE